MPLQVKILFILLLVGIGFSAGWTTHAWKTDSATLAQIQAAEKSTQEMKDRADETEKAYLHVASQLENNKVEVIRYVPKIITQKDDAACTVNSGAVRLYNDSLQGQVTSPQLSDGTPSGVAFSTLASIIAENNLTCQKEFEKLKALQKIVGEYMERQKAE